MTDTRTGMEGLLQQRLGVAEQKQAIVDKARRKKEAQFEPLSIDNLEHVDGDTFRLKDSNQLVRLGGADTFESQEWVYENNPEREQAHKRALSKLTGTPALMISREDLLERGKAQANETKLRISQLAAEGNLGYKQTGVDVHGRQLGELADLRTGENPFADYAGREHNANYHSKFNAEQRIRDLFTGERGEHERFTGPRPWLDTLKDQPVNLVHGAGQMLNDLAQAGTVLAKAGSAPSAGTTAMFDRNRDRLEYFKERFLSPQAKARNRLAQKNATRARQVYNTNYQAYLNAGDSENEAKLKAGISEFGDTIKRLVANPGQILDSTVESLPYMMGVGAVGRAVTTKAATALSKKVAKEAIEAGATVGEAAVKAAQWQASKEGRKAIGRFSTASGVATVGVTEGLSNSADVYASVAGMTEEEAMQSEQYLALREKGLEHGEAVRELATDAFHSTFVKNMALAAAASYATGAANWEARLFTTKADKLKKAVTPKAPATSLTRAVGRGVAKVGKALAPAGVKEAAEEAIQSGGGEFLAQLAKFEATGEEVGPGIGAATAEGAVVGFASGAGISGTLGTLKDIGAADLKKLAAQNPFKGKQGAEAAQAAVAAAVDGTDIPTPEGQPAPAAAPTPVSETPVKTLDDMDFDTEFKNVVANSNRGPIVLYEELNTLSKIARGREKPISAEHQQQLEAYKMLAQEALSDEVTTISGKSSEEINDRDLTILSMAAEMGVDISTDNLSADQKTVIEETVKLAEDLEKVADLTEQQLKLATTEKEKRNIREVAENKFGDLKEGANGRPGLRYYDRRMRELMNTSRYGQDNLEMESLGSGLKAFAESQNDYLDDARQAVTLGKSVGRFIYTAPSKTNKGGSPAMVKILEKEQEKFNAIVGSLRDRYEAWQRASKAGPRIQAPGGAATGSAKDERARQEDEAARRKAGKENVPDKPLRKALENVLKATKVGSRLRTQKLISLMKKARKSKDIYLVGMVSKATNDNDTARRKLQKGSKEEQPESQRDAQGKPKFAENIIPGGFNTTPISGIVGEQGETTETTETAETTETTETPVKETLRTAAAKGTQAVLGFINQSSKLEAVRLVSERLREVLGDRDVEIVELTGDEMLAKFGNAKAKGAYYQGKIYLNTGALTTPTNYLHTVMHEATHAALDGAIKKGLSPELQKRVKDLRFEIIKALTMDGSSQANDMIRFIAKEPEEMLAHALNTPWFRNFLQELQLGEVSAWDKFVQLIADILGISNKSALGEVLDLTESIFQEIAPKKEAAPKITFKEAKDTSKIVPWTREGIEKMFSNSKALERLTDAKLVQLQENIEKVFTVSTGDDTSLDEAGFRYQQAIEQELHSREAEQTIARVAKSLKIPKSFIDLTARVTGAERDTNRRVTDPVTGESFTAIELMDQLEDEGLPRMGPEFQARRGYTEAEIKEYRAWQAAQAQLIERGIAEDDLMYLIGIVDGSLSLPSEEDITRVEAEAQREGPAPASAGVGTETGAEAGTGVELNPAVTPAEPEISPEEAAQAAREEAEKLDKAVRLAEARQLRTLVSAGKVNPDSLYVSNTEDQAFLNRIMPDVPALQAIEQLIDHIEPNPDLQNVPIEPTLPSEVLQTVIEQGAILNTPNNKKTLPARSIPEQLRHLANTAWDKLGKFQRELHAAKLGPTLSAMFKIKRSKVKDLLASNNFIMQTLRDPGSLQKFIEEIGATPAEALALRTFADFYGAFSKTLYGGMDRLSTINSINQVEHVPIYFLQNDKGVFDPNVAGAMALEAMQWIMSDGAQAMFNSAEDIRAILGLPPNAPITGQMWQQVGRGTLQTNVAQQIGFKILSHLNLEAKPGGRALYTESMAASLGAQVMATLIDMGNLTPNSQARIRRHSVSAAAWEQMTGVKPPHSVMMVSNDFNEIRDPNNPQEWKKVDVNAEFRNRVVPGRAIFNRLFASTSNVRTPRFQTMTLADVPKMVSRTISKIPEVMRERMLHDANKHYTTSPSVMGLLEKFEDPEQFLTMAHAYQSEADIARLHQQDRDKAISRNRGLWSDLTEAMDWHKRHGTKKFYLPVRMGGNGRVIQDSNVINPQNSKLHRFMFIREGWQKAITKKAPSDMNDAERMRYNGLMMAIGLGMGLKTDSMLIGEVVSEVEKRMEEDGIWKDALDVLDTEKKFFDKKQRDKLAKVLSEQGTHTLAALHALNNWRNAEDGAAVMISVPHETDGVTNGYIMGLLLTPPDIITPEYKRLLNAGGIYFEGDPWQTYAEYKADPNNLDNYQYIARDSRQYLGNMKREALAPIPANDAKSVKRMKYIRRGISVVGRSNLVPDQAELAKGHKVGRDWAKQPLLEASYGAGAAAIIRSMISDATDTFHTLLAKSNADLDIAIEEALARDDQEAADALEATRAQVTADAMSNAYETVNMVIKAHQQAGIKRYAGKDELGRKLWENYETMATDNPSGRLLAEDVIGLAKAQFGGDIRRMSQEFRLSKEAQRLLAMGLKQTYGTALASAIRDRLAPVLEVRSRLNSTHKLNNLLYVAAYDEKVAELEAAGEVLTAKDKENIRKGLMRQGLVPTIATPESTGVDDSLEMTSSETEYLRSGADNLLEGWGILDRKIQMTAEEFGHNRQRRVPAKTRAITGRLTARKPNADVGVSAVVKAIHAIDGVINSLVWGRGDYAVLNVHDAQVSPWWAATDVAQSANAGFGDILANYDMPQQFIDASLRIQSLLTSDKLSQAAKDAVAVAFYEHVLAHDPLGVDFPAGSSKDKVAAGYWAIDTLQQILEMDHNQVQTGKKTLFGSMRSINQFAQQDTAIAAPNGLEIGSTRTWTGQAPKPVTETKELLKEEPAPDRITPAGQISNDFSDDMMFAEDFSNQTESEKVQSIFDGLAQYENGDIDIPHQSHLRELVEKLITPALTTMGPILEKVLSESGTLEPLANWEGDLLRQKAAGHRLTSNADISLQETAVQDYVTAIVSMAINGDSRTGIDPDHFIRKEVRRLFEAAQEQITPESFLPEEITGDPQIARDLAQQRYDYIFNNPNPNVAYERFLSIGLTNAPFAAALAGITNPETSFNVPSWDKGILRGMMSVFRQILARLSGTSMRYNGGNLSQAMRALAQTTIASNQRNQQRLKDLRDGVDGTSRIQKINAKLVNGVNARFVEPLASGLRSVQRKRLDPENPTLPGFIRAATYVALKTRDSEVRQEYNNFYRAVTSPHNVGKDNFIFETAKEIMPWDQGDMSWKDLLRKSKYMVDMARQEASDHTRTFINDSFDKAQHKTKAHKMAITQTILKTDLSSLLRGPNELTIEDLVNLLIDRNAVTTERGRLEAMLKAALAKDGLPPNMFNLFQNQTLSLGNMMRTGKAQVGNQMQNAHNIVQQYMLDEKDRVRIENATDIESIVDRLATIYALEKQSGNDLRLTNEIVQHEMARQNVGDDNGFSRLLGMQINFKELAKENLFENNPTQMIKGYVYEIFDGDVNIEYVEKGSDREQEVIAMGMMEVGEVQKDSDDNYKGQRVLYKGLRGLATYNKSIVSLTDLQHRGANLFTTNGFQSQNALSNLKDTRARAFNGAKNQFKAGYTKAGANMVPVLNEMGQIVDYRYIMSESAKQQVMKKEDQFDRVLPRMFASITDRNNTKEVNADVVDLLHKEYVALKDDPGTRFIRIGEANDPNATPEQQRASREMWRLLPNDMKRNARSQFKFDGLYVRDDVVNLVMGFRKASISNLKRADGRGALFGKGTPIVRMADKIWLEIVSLMRIKIAILTPAVVVGNIASNMAMLLSEGIPLNYIRKNASEAISGMRAYQKDRKAATELARRIGSAQALGKNVRAMEVRLARLEADLAANPVGQLVEAGLFTSITADLGVDDDTLRGSLIQKAEDALGNKGGKLGRAAAGLVKEVYMLPGSKGYQAAVAATQYGDFVARYIKFKYDTQVGKKTTNPTPQQTERLAELSRQSKTLEGAFNTLEEETKAIADERAEIRRKARQNGGSSGDISTLIQDMYQSEWTALARRERALKERRDARRAEANSLEKEVNSIHNQIRTGTRKLSSGEAINEALAAFIYYDIPQPKGLQTMNDYGLVMFTKFFLRIQHIVARMYTQNPVSALAVLGVQTAVLPKPFSENIANYGMGDGLTHKWNSPWDLPGKVVETLNPAQPALLQWVFNPFGL